MSENLNDPLNTSPNDKDKNVLNLIFGDQTCIDDPITKFIWYFGLAILATIVFWILSLNSVNNFFTAYFNPSGVILIKVVLFFLIILLLDWLFTSWRTTTPVCDNKV